MPRRTLPIDLSIKPRQCLHHSGRLHQVLPFLFSAEFRLLKYHLFCFRRTFLLHVRYNVPIEDEPEEGGKVFSDGVADAVEDAHPCHSRFPWRDTDHYADSFDLIMR
jgi:hypothetical protein